MMNEFGQVPTRKGSLRSAIEAANNSVHTVGMVAFLSGFCGFVVGWIRFASWHQAIESAQVLAGIVHYPADNPFYIYHTKVWSLSIQLCAAMLYAGIPERLIAYVCSGVLGMVGFQALALCAFAFCRNTFLSIAAPWVIVFCLLSRPEQMVLPYPVYFVGPLATFGSLGLSAVFLSIVLFGIGNRRLVGFLLGVCPAFHVVLGLWAWLLVFGCLLWEFPNEGSQWKQTAKFFLLGCGVSLGSLAGHFVTAHKLPHVSPDVSAAYLNAFLQNAYALNSE